MEQFDKVSRRLLLLLHYMLVAAIVGVIIYIRSLLYE